MAVEFDRQEPAAKTGHLPGETFLRNDFGFADRVSQMFPLPRTWNVNFEMRPADMRCALYYLYCAVTGYTHAAQSLTPTHSHSIPVMPGRFPPNSAVDLLFAPADPKIIPLWGFRKHTATFDKPLTLWRSGCKFSHGRSSPPSTVYYIYTSNHGQPNPTSSPFVCIRLHLPLPLPLQLPVLR